MRRVFDFAVVLSCLLIITAAAALAPRWGRRPSVPYVKGYSARITFPEAPDGVLEATVPGRVTIHAAADWKPSGVDFPHMVVPFIEVRRLGPYVPDWGYEYEQVWDNEYPDRAWESLPGQVHRHEFETTIQLPPGLYSVMWGMRRYDYGPAGLVPDLAGRDASSFYVTIH
jgi:hypothetical protein